MTQIQTHKTGASALRPGIGKWKINAITRREFIRNASLTALAGLSIPLLSSCSKEEAEDFLQKHFRK